MSAAVFTPQGHHTFDVHVDGKHLGSVWRYRDGWIAYVPSLRPLPFIFDTVDDAVAALERQP